MIGYFENSFPNVRLGYYLQSSIALIPFCHVPVFQTGYTLCNYRRGYTLLLNRAAKLTATAQELQLQLVSCLLTKELGISAATLIKYVTISGIQIWFEFIFLPKGGKIGR